MAANCSGQGPSHSYLQYFMKQGPQGHPVDLNPCVLALHTEYYVAMGDAIAAMRAVAAVARHWPGWRSWDGQDLTTCGLTITSEVNLIRCLASFFCRYFRFVYCDGYLTVMLLIVFVVLASAVFAAAVTAAAAATAAVSVLVVERCIRPYFLLSVVRR